jgi:hypothetical protein
MLAIEFSNDFNKPGIYIVHIIDTPHVTRVKL